MSRDAYIQRVLRAYREAPDTPQRPRRGDRKIAGQFHDRHIPAELVEYALALAILRRHLRPPDAEPLEPIRSLAYLRPLLDHLQHNPVPDGYRAYVTSKYAGLKREL